MIYFLMALAALLLILIGISVAIMLNLKTLIRNINKELKNLDSKADRVQIPNVRNLDLEEFARQLKRVVQGIRSITPRN